MAFRGAASFVAVDRDGVSAGAIRSGVAGSRLKSLAFTPLAPGVVDPRPFEANVSAPDVLSRVVATAVSSAGLEGAEATLVLSDAVARTALLQPPRDVKTDAYARYRMSQGLPYPPSEAVIGTFPLSAGAVVAAAIRRSVVSEYESVLAAARVAIASVEMATFVALPGLRDTPAGEGSHVDIVLGDAAVTFLGSDATGVRAFRTRRRSGDPDTDWLCAEVERTTAPFSAERPWVRVVGRGAIALVDALKGRGFDAREALVTATGGLALPPCEVVWAGARV